MELRELQNIADHGLGNGSNRRLQDGESGGIDLRDAAADSRIAYCCGGDGCHQST
jgi:hypothetical protein